MASGWQGHLHSQKQVTLASTESNGDPKRISEGRPPESLAGKRTKGREDASRRDQGRDHAPVAVVVEQREHHLRLPPPPPPPPDWGEVRVVAPRTAALASTGSR